MDPLSAVVILAALAVGVLYLARPRGASTAAVAPPEPAPRTPTPSTRPPAVGGPLPRAHAPGVPLPLPERDLERSDRHAALLRSADHEPWTEVRGAAWKARRRWFAEPAWRDRLLAELCPHGGAAPAPPGGRAGVVHRWLAFLAETVEAVDDPELRPRVAALYAPWRGFVLDLRRFVERRRAGLSESERAQLPPPAWLEALARLEGRLFHDLPYDFLDQPLDRSLLEADGARRKPPEAVAEDD